MEYDLSLQFDDKRPVLKPGLVTALRMKDVLEPSREEERPQRFGDSDSVYASQAIAKFPDELLRLTEIPEDGHNIE